MFSLSPHNSSHRSAGAYAVDVSSAVLARGRGVPLGFVDEKRLRALERRVDQVDFCAARVLATILLSFISGIAWQSVRVRQFCEECGGSHGKPTCLVPAGYEVSWSHHEGIVAAAVAEHAIGIDVISRGATGSQPSVMNGKLFCQAEALYKAGARTHGGLLPDDAPGSEAMVYRDTTNRRLRLLDRSSSQWDLYIATSDPVQRHDLASLVVASGGRCLI